LIEHVKATSRKTKLRGKKSPKTRISKSTPKKERKPRVPLKVKTGKGRRQGGSRRSPRLKEGFREWKGRTNQTASISKFGMGEIEVTGAKRGLPHRRKRRIRVSFGSVISSRQ